MLEVRKKGEKAKEEGGTMKKYQLYQVVGRKLHVAEGLGYVCGLEVGENRISRDEQFYPGTVKALKALIDQGKVCKHCLNAMARAGLNVLHEVKLRAK